ncbi:hypothetical protein [Fervidobacterium thailandense]|uniref:Uncharacterized protein n=1 Tax=Fervidobacterium thailandense TaxID=1008305 RepID=A0A1E3G359_9BACT|nr:hypothetical protein [Fervidobacterium thailandense]ODN30602.1 hypothetical protein A4H02_05035 [Fervidobacterium thailandense]
MRNFTFWFIIFVFVTGAIAIVVYENYRFSPKALGIDLNVAKEYLKLKHVDLHDALLKKMLDKAQLKFHKRLSKFDFALEMASFLKLLNDGVTRIEVPIRKTDGKLPFRCKLVGDKVVVVYSECEIPEDSKILSINGYPVEDVIEKYRWFFPNLGEFESRYAFVDKLFHVFPTIIGARAVQVVYQPPNSNIQRLSYIKVTTKMVQVPHPVELVEGTETIVKVKRFEISSKEEFKEVDNLFQSIAQSSTEDSSIVFDLRYAEDGDESLVTRIISHLIDHPVNLYPTLLARYDNQLVSMKQIPIEPAEKIKGKVTFIFDSTCFYTPHKVLAAFLMTQKVAQIVGEVPLKENYFYTGEFWKVLPSTKVFVIFPTQKVVVSEPTYK